METSRIVRRFNQIGGLGGFNRMNVLQKRELVRLVLVLFEFQKLLGGGGETETRSCYQITRRIKRFY